MFIPTKSDAKIMAVADSIVLPNSFQDTTVEMAHAPTIVTKGLSSGTVIFSLPTRVRDSVKTKENHKWMDIWIDR